jgi:hypothetical protein
MKKSDLVIIILGTVLFVGLIATISYLIISNSVAQNIGVIM